MQDKNNEGWNFVKGKIEGLADTEDSIIYNEDGSRSFYNEDGSWGTVDSDGNGSFYGSDGSWGTVDSDENGSFYGSDGSWGTINSDGSGSYYGNDGSWGTINSDGSGSYYGNDGSWESIYSNGDDSYYANNENTESITRNEEKGINDFSIDDNLNIKENKLDKFADDIVYLIKTKKEINNAKRQFVQQLASEYDDKENIDNNSKRIKKSKVKDINILSIFLMMLFVSLTVIVIYFYTNYIPIGISSDDLIGKQYYEVYEILNDAGFDNILDYGLHDLNYEQLKNDGIVTIVEVENDSLFNKDSKFFSNAEIKIYFHSPKYINSPISSEEVSNYDYKEVKTLFEKNGFKNIKFEKKYDLIIGWIKKEGEVESVLIDGYTKFDTEDKFEIDSEIIIIYHTKIKNR